MAHAAIQGRLEPASVTTRRFTQQPTNRNSASSLPSRPWVFGGEEERGRGEISPRVPHEKLLAQIGTHSTCSTPPHADAAAKQRQQRKTQFRKNKRILGSPGPRLAEEAADAVGVPDPAVTR